MSVRRITTGDPTFSPDHPLLVNGFLFLPVEWAAEIVEENACDNGCGGAIRAEGEKLRDRG